MGGIVEGVHLKSNAHLLSKPLNVDPPQGIKGKDMLKDLRIVNARAITSSAIRIRALGLRRFFINPSIEISGVLYN